MIDNKGKKRLMIIDGHAVLHRAWHALPPLATKDGTIVSGAYGFMMTLFRAIRELQPTHVAVTFDLKGKTFRHESYGDYKAGREKKPEEFHAQVPIIRRVLEAMKIPVYATPGYEADDAIGTIVDQAEKADTEIETIVVTGDLDTLQLVDDNTKVYTMRKGISDLVIYDAAAVRERFGLEPNQMVDYKALRGDTSDNIPGVRGIGEKTASELILKFGSVKNLYEALDAKKDELRDSTREKLLAGREAALQALDLCRIRRDAPIEFVLDDTLLQPFDNAILLPLFHEYQFNTLIRQLGERGGIEVVSRGYRGGIEEIPPPVVTPSPSVGGIEAMPAKFLAQIISEVEELSEALKKMAKCQRFVWRSISESESLHAIPSAVGIATDTVAFVITAEALKKGHAKIQKFIDDAPREIVGHDLKREIIAARQLGIELPPRMFDLMIADYLLTSGERRATLDALLSYHRSVAPAAKLFSSPTEATERLGLELPYLMGLADELAAKISAENLDKVMNEIELPLVPVLAKMEQDGVSVDVPYLRELSLDFGKKMEKIAAETFRLAGSTFNLNSPAQVKKVLFEDLALSDAGVKRTAKGKELSTAASELEKLRDAHPIVALILDWRELSKLRSTYVDALVELSDREDGRIHAKFNQAVTATGRLSSSDPNLQNIPTSETEYGRLVRNAFVPARGYRLLAADYSQIELRIAAHLADEPVMIEAFRKGEDIHWRTAVTMFGEGEAAAKRRIAKVINFGILYGMGSNRLAAAANISLVEAREYIARYFSVHRGIADYVERMKAEVNERGYVETIFGRRRHFQNFHSLGQRERAEAERQAVNMPMQGSQADMTKLAMIRINQAIQEKWGDKSPLRMIVQVHDELVFEVKPAALEEAAHMVRETMKSVVKLKVPVEVKVTVGERWGDMNEIKPKTKN